MRLGQLDSFRKLVFVKVAAGGIVGCTGMARYSRRSSHEGPLISSRIRLAKFMNHRFTQE